jgi:hypothetical protein
MGTADETSTGIPEVRSDPVEHASDLLDDALLLTQELRAALHDQLCLVRNEAQLAARSLTAMVAAAIGIGVLGVSAWLGLVAAGAFALIGLGVAPVVAMLIGAALNLIALLVPYEMIRRKSRNLGFPATLRTLRPTSTHSAAGGAAAVGERKAV